MHGNPSTFGRIGYTRREFNAIFQIYSRNVYSGFLRDFSFSEYQGRYFISFCEEAGKTPLITVEKRKVGPDTSLFIATSPSDKGQLKEVARSEKIDSFCHQLSKVIETLRQSRNVSGGNIRNIR